MIGFDIALAFILGFGSGSFMVNYQDGTWDDFDTELCEYEEWQDAEECKVLSKD